LSLGGAVAGKIESGHKKRRSRLLELLRSNTNHKSGIPDFIVVELARTSSFEDGDVVRQIDEGRIALGTHEISFATLRDGSECEKGGGFCLIKDLNEVCSRGRGGNGEGNGRAVGEGDRAVVDRAVGNSRASERDGDVRVGGDEAGRMELRVNKVESDVEDLVLLGINHKREILGLRRGDGLRPARDRWRSRASSIGKTNLSESAANIVVI